MRCCICNGDNFTKQGQVAGFLVEVAKYLSLPSHSAQEKLDFLNVCHDLYIVRCKTPFTKKARHEGRGLDDIDADQAEWRCDGVGGPSTRKVPGTMGFGAGTHPRISASIVSDLLRRSCVSVI